MLPLLGYLGFTTNNVAAEVRAWIIKPSRLGKPRMSPGSTGCHPMFLCPAGAVKPVPERMRQARRSCLLMGSGALSCLPAHRQFLINGRNLTLSCRQWWCQETGRCKDLTGRFIPTLSIHSPVCHLRCQMKIRRDAIGENFPYRKTGSRMNKSASFLTEWIALFIYGATTFGLATPKTAACQQNLTSVQCCRSALTH